MKKIHLQKILKISFVSLLLLNWVFLGFPPHIQEARAATVAIRQEINIINSAFGSESGVFATSSAIIQIDTTKYTSPTYYFEVVASTTAATNATIQLQNATSGVVNASVTVNGTSYDLYRSSSFTPDMSGAGEYMVVTGDEAVGKGAIAARVVILQSADPIAVTETYIEIGSATSTRYTTPNATTTLPLQYPKYWYYDSAQWDGSPAFSVEVTYKDYQVASSTTYATVGTHTYNESLGVSYITIEAWGAGGGGGTQKNLGGGGGGGGAYARSTTTPTGVAHDLVVAAGGGSETTALSDTTYDATVVVADSGTGGGTTQAGGAGGVASPTSVGDVTVVGGDGGAGLSDNDTGGGGGGAAGSSGIGETGQDGQTSTGGYGGLANGGSGGEGNGGSGGAGGAGTTAPIGGGGGGGGDTSSAGGDGGAPGGGGGGSEVDTGAGSGGTGGDGQIIITETHGMTGIALEQDDGVFGTWTNVAQIVTDGVATSSPERIRVSFTPTDGKHYRIVASTTASTASYDIYNAKIVVDQTSPTLLEPQYLLANTKLASGINLQNFLTSWNSVEWSGVTNTYIHQIDSADGSGSVVEIDTAPGGTQVLGSEVSSPDNSATSSSMTMPADGDLDIKATTNQDDIYASRILVRVVPIQNPQIEQRVYRWREDDGNEINASWAAAENTELSSGIFIGDRRRLRFLISNSTASADSIAYRLEYASSSSCTISIPVPAVASSEEWAMDPSYYLSEDNSTTDVSGGLTNPGGKTFFAGYTKNASNQTSAHSLTSGQFTEHEYAIKSTANAQTGLAYCFRLTNAGATTNFIYTMNASTTLSVAARPQTGGGGGEGSGGGNAQTGATDHGGGAGGEGSGGGAPVDGGTGQGGGGDSEE
ncbi:MAG: hypothetical protein Q7R73_02310 [bacterium]|nr:hypothetical protein [bacterium]